MKKISVNIEGHSTSFSLEEDFLEALKKISVEKNKSINQIVCEIDRQRKVNNLSSAIRIYILKEVLSNKVF